MTIHVLLMPLWWQARLQPNISLQKKFMIRNLNIRNGCLNFGKYLDDFYKSLIHDPKQTIFLLYLEHFQHIYIIKLLDTARNTLILKHVYTHCIKCFPSDIKQAFFLHLWGKEKQWVSLQIKRNIEKRFRFEYIAWNLQ